MPFWRMVGRALRLRCPDCGGGRLYRGTLSMHPRCTMCGLDFQPEQGYYVGALYVNYGATVTIVAIAGLLLLEKIPIRTAAWPLGTFAVLFPLSFHRWAKSFWLAFDRFLSGKVPS